ncbi:hypothetical protein [Poriferisphaera sp. WC338]|uniref:hypothetical protein n=1 Tax=Poriferisphaera sp. WC338 TaxID=3425129 RepID=UPI003D8160B4
MNQQTQTKLKINCPACEKQYTWQDQFLGKELHCKCGHLFIPDPPVGAGELSQTAQIAARMKADASRSFSALAQASGRTTSVEAALNERRDEFQINKVLSYYVPIACIFVGIAATLGTMLKAVGDPLAASYLYGILFALQLIVFLPLSLWTLIILAKMFDLSFSDLPTTSLKLAAITFLPAGISDIIFGVFMTYAGLEDIWYLAVCLVPYLVLCGIPATMMFGMGLNDSAIFIILLYLPRLAIFFGIAATFPQIFP